MNTETIIILMALFILVVGIFTGILIGIRMTRLVVYKNRDRQTMENPYYIHLWDPWNSTGMGTRFAFTRHELREPSNRARRQPEDKRNPFFER